MNNIFGNAYFGKPYKTRDGRKAIYAYKREGRHYLIVEYYEHIFTWNDNGVSDAPVQKLDIVSEWQEGINEEELDKLIMNIQIHVCEWNFGGVDKTPYKDLAEYVKEKLNDGLLKEWRDK